MPQQNMGDAMKKLWTLLLVAGMLVAAQGTAAAIDFKASGQWLLGFGVTDSSFVKNPGSQKSGVAGQDTFDARQRVRLKLEAIASESLSGTVQFEMGDTPWGRASKGGALGADGIIVEVKHAYIDWMVPNTELRLRMGLQAIDLPNAAGGSAIFSDDVAGIVANYTFNSNVGLTALWGRLYNDNFAAGDGGYDGPSNFLDNVDMFALSVPISFPGWKITPWAMVAATGNNAVPGIYNSYLGNASNLYVGAGLGTAGFNTASASRNAPAYSTAWWVGLPIIFTGLDPWNFELDLIYGSSEGFGSYTAYTAAGDHRKASSKREGWLVKGLVEYKLDWGIPGLFAWYGSGDQGVADGSGRMPHLEGYGSFTSFMGDNRYAWSMGGGASRTSGYEVSSIYSGTWGIGAQLRDMSFIDKLSHTLRVAYWGGTNSTNMTRFMTDANGVHSKGWDGIDASVMYLTTADWLLEFNLDTTWKIYDNLEATLELAYVVNGIDRDQWRRHGNGGAWEKGDAYKAGVIFRYSF